MSPEARLIFTGQVIVDLVLQVEALPEPGGDTLANGSTVSAGGGYNVMLAARRDGLEVVFAGLSGTGPFGEVVRSALGRAGIDAVQPGLAGRDNGYCVVLVDPSAERTFVTAMGQDQLGADELRRVPVTGKDLVYVSGYSLTHPVTTQALPPWLESLPPSARVLTDPSPLIGELDPDAWARVLVRTDVLTANRREAQIMTGLTDPGESAAALLSRIRPGGFVVVRVGAAGCWLASADRSSPIQVAGFQVPALDSTGAGDTHAGVLAAALSRGFSPVAAAGRANAAAALSVTRAGPATAPTSAEIDRLLASSRPDGQVVGHAP